MACAMLSVLEEHAAAQRQCSQRQSPSFVLPAGLMGDRREAGPFAGCHMGLVQASVALPVSLASALPEDYIANLLSDGVRRAAEHSVLVRGLEGGVASAVDMLQNLMLGQRREQQL